MLEDAPRVCVLGAPNSGRRHYTAVLALSLVDSKGMIGDWRLKDKTEAFEVNYYRNKFLTLGQLLPQDYIIPTFHFQWQNRNQMGSVELCCLKGESFLESTNEQQQIEQLENVTGIIFLVDALPYFKTPTELAAETFQNHSATPEAGTVLRRLINCLRFVEGAFHEGPLSTPIALVYSKRDLLPNMSFAEMSEKSSIALKNMLNIYESNFQERWEGCVSALGQLAKSRAPEDFRPENMLQPFLWLLRHRRKLNRPWQKGAKNMERWKRVNSGKSVFSNIFKGH